MQRYCKLAPNIRKHTVQSRMAAKHGQAVTPMECAELHEAAKHYNAKTVEKRCIVCARPDDAPPEPDPPADVCKHVLPREDLTFRVLAGKVFRTHGAGATFSVKLGKVGDKHSPHGESFL